MPLSWPDLSHQGLTRWGWRTWRQCLLSAVSTSADPPITYKRMFLIKVYVHKRCETVQAGQKEAYVIR